MTGETFLNALAANIAWKEGGISNGVNGAVAVLFIIRNQGYRIREYLNDKYWGLIHESNFIPDVRDPGVQTFLSLVESILNGEVIDKLTNGGTFWGEKPYEGAERVAVVGTLNIWR